MNGISLRYEYERGTVSMFHKLKNMFRRPEVYTKSELEAVEKHISTYFGNCETVFHEIVSPDIHVDLFQIEPTDERNYINVITCGMGAHRMNTPKDYKELSRAELVISLPADWKINDTQEKWWWPLRLLKTIARLPIDTKSWVGWGHTIQFGKGFCGDAGFEGALLLSAAAGANGCEVCELPNGEKVHFYQVIPIYKNEMKFKQKYGANALLDILSEKTGIVVDAERPSVLTDDLEPRIVCMDDGSGHLAKIMEKQLPLDGLAAYQHMAIFLRWLIERDFVCEEFKNVFSDAAACIKGGQYKGDLRIFVRDELKGILSTGFLSKEGEAFTRWYYGYNVNEDHYYPCDVDQYALEFFGEEKFNSPEYQDEAYLFIPWEEKYYQEMAKKIEKRYCQWKSNQ